MAELFVSGDLGTDIAAFLPKQGYDLAKGGWIGNVAPLPGQPRPSCHCLQPAPADLIRLNQTISAE
jgi:hypothetical protein